MLIAGTGRMLRDEAGFSLIEMLASLAILLVVIGSLTILMVSTTSAEVDVARRVQAQQQARLAVEMMRHEIHRACATSHLALADGGASNVQIASPGASTCAAGTAVTWCMSGTGQRWQLRRVPGTPTSCSGGRIEADYITTASVFTLEQPPRRLVTLRVNFPVDVDPSAVGGTYRLQDSLVLRNSTRAP